MRDWPTDFRHLFAELVVFHRVNRVSGFNITRELTRQRGGSKARDAKIRVSTCGSSATAWDMQHLLANVSCPGDIIALTISSWISVPGWKVESRPLKQHEDFLQRHRACEPLASCHFIPTGTTGRDGNKTGPHAERTLTDCSVGTSELFEFPQAVRWCKCYNSFLH
jgi:hypothetical protein